MKTALLVPFLLAGAISFDAAAVDFKIPHFLMTFTAQLRKRMFHTKAREQAGIVHNEDRMSILQRLYEDHFVHQWVNDETGHAYEFEFKVPAGQVLSMSSLEEKTPSFTEWVRLKMDVGEFDYSVRRIEGQFYRAQRRFKTAWWEVTLDDHDPRRLEIAYRDGSRGELFLPSWILGEIIGFKIDGFMLKVSVTTQRRFYVELDVESPGIKAKIGGRRSGATLDFRDIQARNVSYSPAPALLVRLNWQTPTAASAEDLTDDARAEEERQFVGEMRYKYLGLEHIIPNGKNTYTLTFKTQKQASDALAAITKDCASTLASDFTVDVSPKVAGE